MIHRGAFAPETNPIALLIGRLIRSSASGAALPMPNIEGEVAIRRYNNGSECDVIVAFRGPHPAPPPLLRCSQSYAGSPAFGSLISGGFFSDLNVLGRLAVAPIRPCSYEQATMLADGHWWPRHR